jgi:DNA-binding transcriptional ArsR family regulator
MDRPRTGIRLGDGRFLGRPVTDCGLGVESGRGGEKSVSTLVDRLAITQPAVSKHLKVLREAGLVAVRRTVNVGSTACVQRDSSSWTPCAGSMR